MTGFLGFDLLRPAWLAAALAGPAVLAVGVLGLRARARSRARLVDERQIPRFLPRFSPNRARLRVALAAAGALFLGFALVGPVRGYTLRDVRRRGLDLVLCVDTSRSMLVQDLKPDRLTRAKREVAGLLDKLKGDRAAILAFAGDVRDVAPLSHDRATLKAFAATLSPEDNLRGGTDLGGVLERALSLFDGRTGAHEAIVLLTDGEDLEGRGLEVARKARERGIRIYLVGMGTTEGGKIPDGAHGFVKDENQKEVVSKMDGQDLQAIADATGGAYLAAEASPIPLEELYEKRISKLEGRELFAGKERIPHDRFQWPLVLAAACLLGEAGLRERRPGERKPASAALALAFLALPQAAPAVQPWKGTLAQGLAEMQRLSEQNQPDGALAIAERLLAPDGFSRWRERATAQPGWKRTVVLAADPLFAAVGLSELGPVERASVQFAKGVALARAEKRADAAPAFETARALAGPGDLRLDSTYDLGWIALEEGEAQRARIPEISGQPAAVPAAPAPTPAGAAPGPPPPADPLELARAAYLAARERFVEHLKAGSGDEDARANAELAQKRLRELDKIQQKREEEKQKQEQEKKDQQKKDQQQKDQDKKDDPNKDQDKKDQDQKDADKKDSPEKKPDEKPKEDKKDEESDKAKKSQPPQASKEEPLTKEEVMRLLDTLKDREEEGRKLQEQLRRSRRAKVKKDW